VDTLLIDVFNVACVTAVVAFILVYSPFYTHILNRKRDFSVNLLLIAIFTCFSIYGMMSRVEVAGGLLGLSHIGQIVGGLVAGPVVGTGAGLIMGIYRYSLGGVQQIPSTIMTFLPGVLAGCYYMYQRGRAPRTLEAVIFTVVYEIAARGIALGLSPDFEKALIIQKSVALPTIIGHGVAVGLFIFLINKLVKEQRNQAEKERMEGELNLARDIQLSLIPRTFPPFPNIREFDIWAMLEPAREVGGDLYDFFFDGPDNFYIIVGDVAGKGAPAAMFMASTRMLIRTHASTEVSPERILNRVNRELSRDNDTAMFVTLFLGILNIRSGELTYANAGHNLPYLCQDGGILKSVSGGNGPALGVMEDAAYTSSTLTIRPGETLVVYTDGITEAMNRQNEFFGEARLEQVLMKSSCLKSADIIEAVKNEVAGYAAGAYQADDITLLVLKYHGLNVQP
jgi:sigma-B regulation protein RsbU (phosphoserine phosphatase)